MPFILNMPLPIPNPPQNLSFSRVLSIDTPLFLHSRIPHFSIQSPPNPSRTTIIRMGGGPRTFPGGVSKWQWKRMQAKKAKQLLKARLARERQIYEMRKRAEVKAAITELERPWEPLPETRAPTLFSVSADEQLKVLADRFQKAGGFDMWSDRDGPQLFETPEALPTQKRFFPKGLVHSVRPKEQRINGDDEQEQVSLPGDVPAAKNGSATVGEQRKESKTGKTKGRRKFQPAAPDNLKAFDSKRRGSESKEIAETSSKHCGERWFRMRRNASQKSKGSKTVVHHDMTLQHDGSYEF